MNAQRFTNPSEWHIGDLVSLGTVTGGMNYWLITGDFEEKNSEIGPSRKAFVMSIEHGEIVFLYDRLIDVFFGEDAWQGEHWCPHAT